ncbi:MAG TPA: hypothetical protein VK034_16720 [Enhygromyxa sp.]|nr:hypothetical protein [Enhygromyxa sp.]
MSEQVIYQSPMMYRLLRDGDGLLIEVVVGGIAMSAVRVRLSADEADEYEREGSRASDRLASAIMADPRFGGRAYPAPD